MTLTRRRFLGRVAPMSVSAFLPACGGRDETRVGFVEPWPDPAEGSESPFRHGVASGDPSRDAVVLWTRLTPPQSETPSIELEWRMALDPLLVDVVREGVLSTDASVDYTAHVDVAGLESGSTYYYQFRALGQTSVRGRTKTLPAGRVDRMRLGITSCANYPAGFFNAYALLAKTDVDLVVHLGDYIYEFQNGRLGDGTSLGRLPEPAREVVTLEDYRTRHAQYKTDPDLMELHRQHPWVTVWDDHELADNAFEDGAGNHQPATDGDFALRKQSAIRAYREWMPMRQSDEAGRIYRSFACGDLLDLMMLDTRLWGRQVQAPDCDAELTAVGRQLLGPDQEAWLTGELVSSQMRGARWRFVGQQVLFAPLLRSLRGCVTSVDNWDGYTASRERLLEVLRDNHIDNVVMLTGDAHASWAIDVAPDPFDPGAYDPVSGRGSELVELVTPGVSSPGTGQPVLPILRAHPHVKFLDQTRQGFVLIDVTHERAQAEWYFVTTVQERLAEGELGAVFTTRAGEPRLVPGAEPSLERRGAPVLAP